MKMFMVLENFVHDDRRTECFCLSNDKGKCLDKIASVCELLMLELTKKNKNVFTAKIKNAKSDFVEFTIKEIMTL